MILLAGDIGGTKSNLGLFDQDGAGRGCAPTAGSLRQLAAATFRSADFADLAAVVTAFLRREDVRHAQDGRPLAVACFGVAGPVAANRSSTPNLAWDIDGEAVAAASGVPAVRLVNDLYATAAGIPLLAESELATLQPGGAGSAVGHAAAERGNQALIAAGTGLGMALMPLAGHERLIVPSEGGHADYAPRDEDEAGLMLGLRRQFGEHVSIERVVSGRGLQAIYEHLRGAGYAPESAEVRQAVDAGDPAAAIAAAAQDGDRLASRAMDMFTAAYGAAAGNLALTAMATGGVYLGGGIAPKNLSKLQSGLFLRSFQDKGRFSELLARIPVRVILNDRTALLGAARCAADRLPVVPAAAAVLS